MRFGLGPFAAEKHEGIGWTEAYELMGEAVRAAESWGFESAWVAERGFTDDGYCPSSFIAAANLAAKTDSIRIGVLPVLGLTHPLYVAEDAAVLDNLSGGRAIIAPVNAVAHELAAHGLGEQEYHERYVESLDVLTRAWASRPFSFHGSHWTIPAQLEGHVENVSGTVTVTPKPAQFELPLWIGGFWQPGRDIAAELGLPMVLGAVSENSALGAHWAAYDAAAPRQGRRTPRVLIRDVYVSHSADAAAEVAPMLARQFQRYADWGLWQGEASDFASLAAGRFIIGSPEQVIAEIRDLDDAFGLDHLVCRMHFPGMPLHQLLASMKLFSSEVIPEFRMPDLPRQIRVGV